MSIERSNSASSASSSEPPGFPSTPASLYPRRARQPSGWTPRMAPLCLHQRLGHVSVLTLPPAYEVPNKEIHHKVLQIIRLRLCVLLFLWVLLTAAIVMLIRVTAEESKASLGILGGAVIGSILIGTIAYFVNQKMKLDAFAQLNMIDDSMSIQEVFDLFKEFDSAVQDGRSIRRPSMVMRMGNPSVDTLPLYESEFSIRFTPRLAPVSGNSQGLPGAPVLTPSDAFQLPPMTYFPHDP